MARALDNALAAARVVLTAMGDHPVLCAAEGPLCADLDGDSLHASVRVEARDRDRLEHLCRYAGRPALAAERLVELDDGRVTYRMKRRWQDGTTAVVMTKQVLMERLCALVPRPRRHLVTHHGVFAPAAASGE